MRPDFEQTGAQVIKEPFPKTRDALRTWRATRPLAGLVEHLGAAIAILRSRPEVVWCNSVLSACYVRPAVRLRKRVILHAHEPEERMAQVLARYRLDKYWSSTFLVGCSPLACADLAAVTKQPADKVHCVLSVPNGDRVRDLARAAAPLLPAHGVVVGATGTVDRRKGVDVWLDMVAMVVAEVSDLDPYFVWVGGDPPAEFESWATHTGLRDRVTFTGSVENPYPWIAAFDVFTLTSRSDPFPLSVLEAMTLGLPVVASAVGDVPHQVGEAGRLVAAESPVDAAEAVVTLLRDPEARRRLGHAAADRVRTHFAWSDFQATVLTVVMSARAAEKR
jgi:glycosyltransferase involved in cell wall biosynthesis